MKISFVIPAYNEEKYIGFCVDSIIQNTPLDRSEYEIIVSNNNSTDNTTTVAESHGAKVVTELEKGTSKTRQRGANETTSDWIAFIDSDCRLGASWYPTFLKLQQKYPKAICFSGPYRYYDGSKVKRLFLNILWSISAPITYRIFGYMILGGNFIVKKQALNDIGGFDTSIKFYGDDTDTARRLSKIGKVIFSMRFYNFSSMRRFSMQGIIKTNVLYVMNFLWPVFFKKPFSNE